MHLSLKTQIQHFLVISVLFSLTHTEPWYTEAVPGKMGLSQGEEMQVERLEYGFPLYSDPGSPMDSFTAPIADNLIMFLAPFLLKANYVK